MKQLYDLAKDGLKSIFGNEAMDFRFEQYQYDEKTEKTEIVISFLVKKDYSTQIERAMSSISLPYERLYKQITFSQNNEIENILIFNK